MERKTVHALLLSLAVVAGGVMMTTDAHAQTNTERLITTVDNTNSIMASLSALADAVANGFASVLEALGMVQANTDAIMAELGHVEGELQAIDSDLADVSSNVASVQSDVADLSGGLADVNSNIQSVKDDVAGLAGTVGGSAASFASLADTVQSNSVAINSLSEKLDMISEAVGAVQETVEADPVDEVDPITKLLDESDDVDVALADFAGTLKKAPSDNEYEATNSFSCTGDVFVQKASTGSVNPGISNSGQAVANGDLKITVNDQLLYERFFVAAEGATASLYNQPITFESPLLLVAGESLDIEGTTTFHDDNLKWDDGSANSTHPVTLDAYANALNARAVVTDGDTAEDATDDLKKADVEDLAIYNVEIEWFATDPTTECSISSAAGTESGLTNTGKVLVGLNLVNADAAPPSQLVAGTVDCNEERAEITGASIRVGATVGDTALGQYINLVLEAGDESADVEFNSDGTLNVDDSELPFEFSGTSLTVNGTAINNILVQLDYATVDNNSCKAN